MRRRIPLIVGSVVLLALTPSGTRLGKIKPKADWLQFSTSSDERDNPITTANVGTLGLAWRTALPEGCDGSPIYVRGILTSDGNVHDLVIVSTTNGRVVALDAKSGDILWKTTPAAGPRWTTSSPAVDPDRRFVFAYGLDGCVHKYALENGRESTGHGWPARVTFKPDVEKGSSNISIATARDGRTFLYMPVAAYPEPGDDGDYQGHLVTVNIETGEHNVFNALCSDRSIVFTYAKSTNCDKTQAGIWARSGAVYDLETDRVFVTTGNGTYDADQGGFNWGSSVVALRPDGSTNRGTPLDSYTPSDYQRLTDEDLDLSSSTIEILPLAWFIDDLHLGAQGGKDGRLRLLNLADLSGEGEPRHIGGELQRIDLPQGGGVFTQPATWLDPKTKRTWIFVTNGRGTVGYQLVTHPSPRLVQKWVNAVGGTTPVIANGVIFIAAGHAFRALDAKSGTVLWKNLDFGNIHWQSPIIMNGMVYVVSDTYLSAYALK